MSSAPPRRTVALPHVERVERNRVLAGVCSGIGESLAIDPTLVRLVFALLAFASGAGILAYLGAWSLLPAPGESTQSKQRRVMGTVMLVWSAILALRGLGLADSLVWPLALIAAAAALATGAATFGLDEKRTRIGAIVITVLAVVLFVERNSHGRSTTLLAPGAVAAALVLVLGPWAWRLVRERDAEHAARIRTQERADLATRVHDSVLQTLALIQRDPSDTRRVATLARRQERELRTWLYPDREPAAEGTLGAALETAAAEVEELHGVRVEVVRTGDAPLDDRARVLVLAAREAMTNAAKHSGAEEVSVFLDATAEHIGLYVRDRGVGFDVDGVASDRRGISESIRGRMERVGGTATVASSPGEGTDVELELSS